MSNLIDPQYFSIESLVKTELPPLPSSVMRISSLVADMNVSQSAIAAAIGIDPILSARILRLANSAIYGLHGTVTNLTSAVSTVGNNAISDMLLMHGVSDAFGRKILGSDPGKAIWLHLLGTAIAASEICRAAGMRGADEAFSCGLLHDIGKLILLRADAPLYTEILEEGLQKGDLCEVEQRFFGFDHAELGAAASLSWELPPAVSHMIRYHHQPAFATAGIAMAYIIHVADRFVTLKTRDEDLGELLTSEAVMTLRLNAEQFDEIWEAVSARLDEISGAFL